MFLSVDDVSHTIPPNTIYIVILKSTYVRLACDFQSKFAHFLIHFVYIAWECMYKKTIQVEQCWGLW